MEIPLRSDARQSLRAWLNMAASPIFTHLLVSPDDLPFWEYDGQDGFEYLTLLDSVGDLTFPDTATTHIASELTGPWAMYQLLTGHTPHSDTASACAATAHAQGQDLLAQRIEAALPAIRDEPDMKRAGDLFTDVVLAGPWSTVFQTQDVLCDRFARWLQAELPRKPVASHATLEQEFLELWAATKATHPTVWNAYQRERGI